MIATKVRSAASKTRRRAGPCPRFENMQELQDSLGGIPASRILFDPPPGTATVKDVIRYVDGDDRRLVELVNGTLVEKAMGAKEGFLASFLGRMVGNFSDDNGDLGVVIGADGTLRILPGMVRLPDMSFFVWEKFPDRKLHSAAVPALVPDIAVEVVSKGNTKAEMTRKIGDYFTAGVRLVWLVFPKARTVRVYTSAKDSELLTEADTLTGGAVLPGFALLLVKLFEKLPDEPTRKKAKPKKRKK